jgi:GntR family transcriptional regulator
MIEGVKRRIEEARGREPLYRQVMAAIEGEIAAGSLRPGDHLPGERDLAAALELSRVTVRKAIGELVDAGLLERRHGARTCVRARVEKTLSNLTSFSEDIRQRGMTPGCRWILKRLVRPDPAERAALELGPGAAALRLARVRTADGAPIALEVSTVPTAFLASPELVGDSLYEALAAVGAMPARAIQRLRAALPTPQDCAELECPPTTLLLEAERRCFLVDGRVVEFCRTRYRADVYDFVVELRR